ncbi:tetratricopeptide repeat protein [Helicobacter cynogastricus]|uniref:tetratricopeptide repeat protein n=1 Tax=Helicobacter cynogastricus TaxID=329937 RepID=UPI000CF09BBE|nr:tetratricopeptide repeat protein [Helicobacter cynogastricus]
MKTKMKVAVCALVLGASVLGARNSADDPKQCGVEVPDVGYVAYEMMVSAVRNAESARLEQLGFRKEDAIACFKAAAQAGVPTAYANLGELYEEAKQYKKALEAYQKGVDKGDDAAMIQLGTMYSSGLGIAKDYHKAFKYFEKASLKGNVAGLLELGFMYENGWGVKQDYAKAMEYYQKGKKGKDGGAVVGAYWSIGRLYFNGLGVEKDYAKAVEYLNVVTTGDFAGEANRILGSIYENGGYGVKRDGEKAATYYKEGAEAGDKEAKKNFIRLLNAAAKAYQNGEGVVAQSYNNAIHLYQEAADAGDSDGYARIY